MKFATLLAIAAVVAAVALATKVEQPPKAHHMDMQHAVAMFHAWMKKVGRVYTSKSEEQHRFGVYVRNVQRLSKQQGRLFGLDQQNNMLDLTYEEFVKRYTVKRSVLVGNSSRPKSSVDVEKVVPSQPSEHFEVGNYTREDGTLGATYKWAYVTSIKNQDQCGSCWAFSTCAVLEGMWGKKKYATPSSLSPQELVSCYAGDCDGRNVQEVATWVKGRKIVTWSLYPYTSGGGSVGRCTTPSNPASASYVVPKQGTQSFPANWQTALSTSGPAIIVVYTCPSFQDYYGSKVYNCDCAANDELHAMALYGYTDTYWIIKNSWDTNWGANGWLYLKRGVNACGISDEGLEQYTLN